MAEKILIDAGEKQKIHALHGKPDDGAIGHLEKTLVLMVHDFPGRKNGFGDVFVTLEEHLVDRGFNTLRFDFRGCGESDGRAEHFTLAGAGEDIQQVLDWAKHEGYEHFIFAGEGIGATLCLLNANLSISGNILLWPVLDLKQRAEAFAGGDTAHIKADKSGYIEADGHRIGQHLVQEMSKTDMVFAIKEAYAPTLIMHGAEDKIIPVRQLDLARQHLPARRVEITVFHDGDHGLSNIKHRKMMFYHIFQFLEKYA